MEALKDADRRKDEFLAMLAHELRNPLGPIRNAVGIMRIWRVAIRTSVALARDMLERQVGQLSRIIDDLDRYQSYRREEDRACATNGYGRTPEDRGGGARDVPIAASRAARQHLDCVAAGRTACTFDGDQVRLAQVLINLLNNSARYTGREGEIAVSAERVPADGKMRVAGSPGNVVLRVRDSGIGISSELLPHVFDAFTQGDANDHRGGLGVGLSIVQSLVEMHGGDVQALSAGPGKGSEFVVRAAARRAAAGVRAGRSRRSPAGNRDAAACPRRG